jgi:hypothetical protein
MLSENKEINVYLRKIKTVWGSLPCLNLIRATVILEFDLAFTSQSADTEDFMRH